MCECGLKESRLRGEELQLDQQARDHEELRHREPNPQRDTASGTWRDERPYADERDERQRVEAIQSDHPSRMMPDEAPCRRECADRAAPIFDDDASLRVVGEDVDEEHEETKGGVERHAPGERGALDAQVAGERLVHLTEQPWVNVREQPPVHEANESAEPEEPKEERAAGREEAIRARRPLPGVSIDDAAR